MKTTVVIENGKVTVQVESKDGETYTVTQGPADVKVLPLARDPSTQNRVEKHAAQSKDPIQSFPLKVCANCNKKYDGKSVDGLYCSDDCSDVAKKQSEIRVKSAEPAPAHKPRKVPDADNCGWCKRRGEPCVKHGGTPTAKPKKANHVEQGDNYSLKAGVEKPADYNATGEIAQEPTYDKYDDDQWNCAMCRNAGDFCVLYERMNNEGKRPPFNVRSL